jgi:hypothetical protein
MLESGPHRFFFSSDRSEPPHVHVMRERKLAKFWLGPVRLATSVGFGKRETKGLARLVSKHTEIRKAWHEYFGIPAVASLLLSHHRLASMNSGTFAAEGFWHYLPFYATAGFVLAYGFGLRFRRIPAAHGRFMLCTAIPLVDPVLGRLLAFYVPPLPSPWLYQVVTFAVATVIAGLLVFSYRGAAAARRALVGYFVVLVFLQLGWFVIAPTALWLETVRWFRGIPLT